jgi:DNA invertase Pin-like site-specific DNA recombinase
VVEQITQHASLVSIRDSFDTTSAMGQAMLAIFAALSSLERNALIERTKSGIKTARATRDGRWGRPEKQFDTLRTVQMRSEGASLRELAKAVGVSLGKLHEFFHKRDCSEKACS